jgi:carbonic anhydrase/acetyltransferase-like protein (isoleucine patch superfamily)
VKIGARTNVQDGTVVHVADDGPCTIGVEVVVGHRAVLHACRVEDACLVGMQATILDGAVIGRGSIVGAGALVTARTIVPPHSLVLGSPARVVKTLTSDDESTTRELARKYVRLKDDYLRDPGATPSVRP